MKKALLLLALAVCTTLGASAKSLVLVLSDSTKVYYKLGGDVNPVMRVEGDVVTVNADTYTFANVEKFYISETDDPSGIADLQADGSAEFKDGVLYVQSAGPVRVFTADGRLVKAATSGEGAIKAIDAAQLPAGTYIISAGGKSMKFMKK